MVSGFVSDEHHDDQISRDGFLIAEGLELLSFYKSIGAAEIRAALFHLIKTLKSQTVAVARGQDTIAATFWAHPIVDLAQRGRRDPADLSVNEIRTVCNALVAHYAQMGIEGGHGHAQTQTR